MDGRQKVLEDCCTSTNKIVMVLPEIAKIVVATDAITTTLWGSQYHLQLPPCLQYLHGCYLNIKFHLYFWFCSYSCLFEAGYDIMEPAGASSSGPWGPAAKSNVADCMTYLDSKFYSPVALLSTLMFKVSTTQTSMALLGTLGPATRKLRISTWKKML